MLLTGSSSTSNLKLCTRPGMYIGCNCLLWVTSLSTVAHLLTKWVHVRCVYHMWVHMHHLGPDCLALNAYVTSTMPTAVDNMCARPDICSVPTQGAGLTAVMGCDAVGRR